MTWCAYAVMTWLQIQSDGSSTAQMLLSGCCKWQAKRQACCDLSLVSAINPKPSWQIPGADAAAAEPRPQGTLFNVSRVTLMIQYHRMDNSAREVTSWRRARAMLCRDSWASS